MIIVEQKNSEHNFEAVTLQSIANMKLVAEALKWLKLYNHHYHEYPDLSEIDTLEENVTDEISCLKEIINVLPESATVKSDYTAPDINLNDVARNNVLKLPIEYDKPVWLNDIPHGEELAFPWLFPDGLNGIYNNRDTPLTTLKYFQSRLYNQDSRWRKENLSNVCSKSFRKNNFTKHNRYSHEKN